MPVQPPRSLVQQDANRRLLNVWDYVQVGLVYPSPHAIYASFWLKDENAITLQDLARLMNKISGFITHNINPNITPEEPPNYDNTTAVLGVDIGLWKKISQGRIPKGMELVYKSNDNPNISTIFERSNGAYVNSRAHLWFHIKSDTLANCQSVFEFIKLKLSPKLIPESEGRGVYSVEASSKSERPDGHNGKVLGARFSENLNNPSDPISISKHVLIGPDDIEHLGGSFVMAQRQVIDWEQVHQMSDVEVSKIIGRKTDDTILPTRDTKTHINTSRIQDKEGNTTPLLRLGLPFGRYQTSDPYLSTQGSNVADEKGIYFAGYCNSVSVFEHIINNQLSGNAPFMRDRLLGAVRSDLGGFFYVPSTYDLGLNSTNAPYYAARSTWSKKTESNWANFPGVDWKRLDRHFANKSPSRYMFYNHQDYLFRMATMSDKKKREFEPPTARILGILENVFSRWQDNWYRNRKQPKIQKLTYYMEKYQGNDKPENIEQASIMLRKAWATRLTLHLYTDKNYGFRGTKLKRSPEATELETFFGNYCPEFCQLITGADTYRIQLDEIIVGGMPNLSMGQGRYVMEYLNRDERAQAYIKNLSEASGVGHVVPAYDNLLKCGFGELKKEIKKLRDERTQTKERDFYEACLITLEGVSDYCNRYAALALEMANEIPGNSGLSEERKNLLTIAERMRDLSFKKPKHFIDGVQLIFVMHCCLHLTGEPTALGRFDQLLIELYQKDIRNKVLTKEHAQEIIDAFFIKLDEKVQLNRLNVEDHQPFGNLAMGGASGAYPQGAAINQWVQQLTIGGTIANDSDPEGEGDPAYNELTLHCLKAIRRLPLNAPCVSLRIRSDIENTALGIEIVEEAAKAILSGGAHPIFLNDDLLIKELQKSGDHIGGSYVTDNGAHTRWNSTVSLTDARDYACDGCYEPQFAGKNWFSLGGITTLKPLECAMNGGRTYSTAGPGYLRGIKESYLDEPQEDITLFGEIPEHSFVEDPKTFLELYFAHFEILYTSSVVAQLKTFGANTEYCPSPLLSILIEGCTEKGRDLYEGGAKYNVYAPCFIALSSTINSLYAIRQMVFDSTQARTTLSELSDCLLCDWGYKMVAPVVDDLNEGEIIAKSVHFKSLRNIALSLPRYGRGIKDIDDFGNNIIEKIAQIAMDVFTHPKGAVAEQLTRLAKEYGSDEHPFGIQVQPGVGTFENHVEMGAWSGASADGRRLGDSIASDLSPAPSPGDLPVDHQPAEFESSLMGFKSRGTRLMTDGAPTDFNITEDTLEADVQGFIRAFIRGNGSNILTITTASPKTMVGAMKDPERYNLLRVRTGGWSEFFAAMFPDKQEQHRRRPLSTASTAKPHTQSYKTITSNAESSQPISKRAEEIGESAVKVGGTKGFVGGINSAY